jgi:nucleoside-diphosphate-sugar epimerase
VKLLAVGGTRFLGRHVVQYALDAGHRVTLFHRGRSNADLSLLGSDESAPLATLDDPATEVIDGHTYGAVNALCERVLEEAMPARARIVRPGLLVGPHDPTGRFTRWVPPDSADVHAVSIARARSAGLHTRALADTLRDTAAWAQDAATVVPSTVGLSAEREAALLSRAS